MNMASKDEEEMLMYREGNNVGKGDADADTDANADRRALAQPFGVGTGAQSVSIGGERLEGWTWES